MRRGPILPLLLISIAAAAVATAFALIPRWLPVEASEEAARINDVLWFTTAICIGIFGIVAGIAVYSIWKFRARPDDDSDGAPIHGHTGLEIAWTAGPTILVTVIIALSAVVLAKNGDAGSNPMRVDVLAQQFAWNFSYPQQGEVTSGTLRLPLGRTVELHLQAKDVLHSFWVPELAQKQDTVPGLDTRIVITPTKVGTFPVLCTELCGLGHAFMRTQAIVMTSQAFDAWIADQRQKLAGPAGEAGKAVFANNGCGSCHTLKAAGATGNVGPDLDNLQEAAQTAGAPLEDFVRQSIVDPNAYVAPGFPSNVMPQTFADLPKEQLDALVEYLVESAAEGGGR